MNSALDDPQETSPESKSGARTYEDGCTECGQPGTIKAGTVEGGYQCSDCWEKNGWADERREEMTGGSVLERTSF